MSELTAISWCDHTFNPWWGCEKVSPGCKHCYAETLAKRFAPGMQLWGPGRKFRTFGDAYWRLPLKWDRAAAKAGRRARVFCASMADVFDDEAPGIERAKLWAVIRTTPNLDWLLLTKRPEYLASLLPVDWGDGWPNVWLGTSVETQQYADDRIPHLLATPAAVRFLSCEPLIGPVDLRMDRPVVLPRVETFVDWVIVGGESGDDFRGMDLAWMESLVRRTGSRNTTKYRATEKGRRKWAEYLARTRERRIARMRVYYRAVVGPKTRKPAQVKRCATELCAGTFVVQGKGGNRRLFCDECVAIFYPSRARKRAKRAA